MTKMVKSLEIILYEPWLKEKEGMHLKGCHTEEEFKLYCVVFIHGTRVSGRKYVKVDIQFLSCQKWARLLEDVENS